MNHSGTMQLFMAFYKGKRFGKIYTAKQRDKVNDMFLNIEWRNANQ